MLEIEIDGKKVEVPDGSTVMDAAHKAGTYVPHFCYHKKLSIAANCRMCLVEVEKAPKALPACATPVTPGMKVSTHSEKAVKAQKAVMEFLLINHPLDCPICDQGGECQLQDLAMGYGAPASRYKEEKRVVFNKNLGPLIATDMTRCIHCTRCVRFGQEVAGIMELGMANRGEHSEILTFVGKTVDSEISGNVIDLCPVGALTSKPFRFAARTWELSRRKTISPHDSLGSNLIAQVKLDEVKRILPLENEEINECWLSDKDRFSYDGLKAEDRLTQPMIKQGGQWQTVDWPTALDYVADVFKGVRHDHGADAIGALVSPHSTLEELYLAGKLMRAVGSDNIDFRLRQSNFGLDGKRAGAPWLGMPVAELGHLDAALIIGSFLRKDHPLIAQRLRQAVRRGASVARVHATADDLLMRVDAEAIVPPSQFAAVLAEVVAALVANSGTGASAQVAGLIAGVKAGEGASRIAAQLVTGEKRAVLLGNFAVQHPDADVLHVLAQEIARLAGANFGVIGEAANSVGGHLARALPQATGKNVARMLAEPLKAYVLFGIDGALDVADGAALRRALAAAESVVHIGAFVGEAAEYADVMLPIAPFSETSGTFVNTEGRAQSFNAVARPWGDCRPGWKVLRVLGNLVGAEGFDYVSSEAVRDEALAGEWKAGLNNAVSFADARLPASIDGLQRVADVPIYFADPLVRRSEPLQKTRDARVAGVRMSGATLSARGLTEGADVRVRSVAGEAVMKLIRDDAVAQGCIQVPTAFAPAVPLGPMFGTLNVEAV